MPSLRFALFPVLLGAAFAASAGPSFNDGVLGLADYTQILLDPDPTVSVSISTLAAGGNPGSALDIHFTNANAPVSMNSFQGFINNTFVYAPSAQGALSGVDYSNDRYVSVGPELAGLTTVTRALVSQLGRYYVATIADPASQPRNSWFTTSATGLGSAAFNGFSFTTGLTDFAAHPDFSTTGSTLAFGFVNRLLLDTGGQPVHLDADFRYDNIAYGLQVAAIPEPGTWALMLAALPLAGAVARRRRARGVA